MNEPSVMTLDNMKKAKIMMDMAEEAGDCRPPIEMVEAPTMEFQCWACGGKCERHVIERLGWDDQEWFKCETCGKEYR